MENLLLEGMLYYHYLLANDDNIVSPLIIMNKKL